MTDSRTFEPWLTRWQLVPDGATITTPSARLLPVRHHGGPAMLKIASDRSERGAALLLRWWDGRGAARVLDSDGEALLIERATGPRSLTRMAADGADDEATAVLCSVLEELHRPRREPTPPLEWLDEWFRDLWPGAPEAPAPRERWIAIAARITAELMADPQAPVTLHGDLHHGNVLDFGARGWLAIDPKHLWGERAFDYASLFANPDKADPRLVVGRDSRRFERRVAIVAERAGLDRDRLLGWIIAWSGLSATWLAADGVDPAIDRRVFELALGQLARP